jgi:hypothetical protein
MSGLGSEISMVIFFFRFLRLVFPKIKDKYQKLNIKINVPIN